MSTNPILYQIVDVLANGPQKIKSHLFWILLLLSVIAFIQGYRAGGAGSIFMTFVVFALTLGLVFLNKLSKYINTSQHLIIALGVYIVLAFVTVSVLKSRVSDLDEKDEKKAKAEDSKRATNALAILTTLYLAIGVGITYLGTPKLKSWAEQGYFL